MGHGINFRDALGAILVAAFIAVIGGLFWRVIPKENEQLIVYMLGQLSGFVSAVVALHYVQKADDAALDKARTENTGKALDAIAAAAGAGVSGDTALNHAERPAGTADDPVHVEEKQP